MCKYADANGCLDCKEPFLSPNDLRQLKSLAFKMGADAFRRRMEDWLNNDTFEDENNPLTVLRVRAALMETTAEISRVTHP